MKLSIINKNKKQKTKGSRICAYSYRVDFSIAKRRKNFSLSPAKTKRKQENMDIVKNKDISVLNERRRGIRPAKSLFYFYVDNVDALNRATFSKEKLGAELNVSARTVANYILALANAGVIKYKYSGSMRLNPKNYFEGTQENYEKALLEYATFKSDV